jgi:hypothetical protein
MSIINLNIQQHNKKSNNFVFYSNREYEELYGWPKQLDKDKAYCQGFARVAYNKQKSISLDNLKTHVKNYTNCDKLVLKCLLSLSLTARKNNKPLQIKNQTLANNVGCSVYSVQKAKKKLINDNILFQTQSNKYAVPVYAFLIDAKTRGALYNLITETVPHILKIKEPVKALKKSKFQAHREAVKAAKLKNISYPHIHNLVDTDKRESFIYLKKLDRKKDKNLDKEILKRLNPDFVNNLKAENDLKQEFIQKSSTLNDLNLRHKLIEKAKRMYPDLSLSDCSNDFDLWRTKFNYRNTCIKNKIDELFKIHGLR